MDRIGAGFFVLFGLFLAYQASRLPVGTMNEGPGPGFLPLVLGIGMAGLGVVSFLRPEIERIEAPNVGRVLLILGTLVAYAVALEPLGYVLTTFALLAFLLLAFNQRRPWLVGLAAATAVGSYYVFRILLEVPLPPDPLGWWL